MKLHRPITGQEKKRIECPPNVSQLPLELPDIPGLDLQVIPLQPSPVGIGPPTAAFWVGCGDAKQYMLLVVAAGPIDKVHCPLEALEFLSHG